MGDAIGYREETGKHKGGGCSSNAVVSEDAKERYPTLGFTAGWKKVARKVRSGGGEERWGT
jgi:hypothetical protein